MTVWTNEWVGVHGMEGSVSERERLVTAYRLLVQLSYDDCWCQVSLGNPMYSTHTNLCRSARRFTKELEQYLTATGIEARDGV